MRAAIIGLFAVIALLGKGEVEAIQISAHHKHKKEAAKKHHHKHKHHKKHKKDDKDSDEEIQIEEKQKADNKEAAEITAKADTGLKNLQDNDASLSDMLSFSKAIAQGKTAQEALEEEQKKAKAAQEAEKKAIQEAQVKA